MMRGELSMAAADDPMCASPGAVDANPGASPPLVVAIGGTLRRNSSTEKVLRLVLDRCAEQGAATCLITGEDLVMPPYAPEQAERSETATRLVDAIRRADAILIGSPGYHGGISGLVKNALDYVEDLREACSYFGGRPVGCVATGAGWQGAVATLNAIRSTVHALRGWPTPLGIAVNTADPLFSNDGSGVSTALAGNCAELARQMLEFVSAQRALEARHG